MASTGTTSGTGAGTGSRIAVALLAVAAFVPTACSSSGSSTSASTSASTSGNAAGTTAGTAPSASTSPTESSTAGTAAQRPGCTRPAADPVSAQPVAGVTSDFDIPSFDGTIIRAHWFPLPSAAADTPAPTILMGPGWGSGGDTNVDAAGLLGALSIGTLRTAGYNVLTWDPRGFGVSSGTVTIDSADHEGLDVGRLLDWVAAQPQAALDNSGDPRVGMVGASYGGGIQLVTAAIDCRVDAIVPIIAWHSLITSLFKSDTAKTGWAGVLTLASAGRKLDPTIDRTNAASKATGVIDPADKAWFADRGPGDLVGKITAPTLLIQGTVDTLFTLDEAVTNYRILHDAGVPVSMLWFCGGHGICLTKQGDASRTAKAAIAWLNRYVKDDATVSTGPRFEFIDQDGAGYTAPDYPVAAGAAVTAEGSGTLSLVADGGAGPVTSTSTGSILDAIVPPITPARATNAVNVSIVAPATTAIIVGAPELTITYSGTTPDGQRPTRVFAQLVDDATGIVLGNQITPIAVTLDGQPHTVTVPLEMVAFTFRPDTSLTLQIVATTVAYAQPRLGGSVTLTSVSVKLPTATGVTPM
ncbi:unannotated protein [freshwater metagenome]|uniref:Unannotated protein n=1 Tax=freshwater metagenome TaxID=449393 RepID=A0A6J7EFP1_9ZZZZ